MNFYSAFNKFYINKPLVNFGVFNSFCRKKAKPEMAAKFDNIRKKDRIKA